VDSTYFLTVKAEGNTAAFGAGPAPDIGIDLPMKVEGIEDNGCAAVYSNLRPRFRFVAVHKGAAYFQEPIDEKQNDIWVGNVFIADNKDIRFTLIKDGTSEKPRLEIHNPTDAPVKTKIRSPKGAPEFGGMEFEVDVPAGSSFVKGLQ